MTGEDIKAARQLLGEAAAEARIELALERARGARTDRLQGACEAMSRFLVWVYLEAEHAQPPWHPSEYVSRVEYLVGAIEAGYFRLEWGAPVSRYKPIPIIAARHIAEAYAKDQVVIVAWDAEHGRTHVTTYGRTVDDCEEAALDRDREVKELRAQAKTDAARIAELERERDDALLRTRPGPTEDDVAAAKRRGR